MGRAISGFVPGLVGDEIKRIVAARSKDGSVLSAAAAAAEIANASPGCGLSESEIADQLMMAAASAGVAVEIGAIPPPVRKAPV